MAELLEALTQRRARRSFAPDAVPADIQQALWQAVQVAPSHANAQPTRILVANSETTHQQLVQALSAGNRSWAPAAPLLFALAALPAHDTMFESTEREQRALWAFHAGIAAGNLMAQATAMGLIAHPMASFDEAAVRGVFEAPGDLRVLAVFAVGYPGTLESLPDDLQRKEQSPQERLPLERLVAGDHWEERMGVSAHELRKERRK